MNIFLRNTLLFSGVWVAVSMMALPVWALNPDEQEELQDGLLSGCIEQMRQQHESGGVDVPLKTLQGFCQCSSSETVKAVSSWNEERLVDQDKPSAEYLTVMLQAASTCKAKFGP